MTTKTNNFKNANENTSEELLKALALKQFNGEDFFLSEDGMKAYEGTEDEAREEWEQDPTTGTEEGLTFNDWQEDNLTEIEEISEDEERDGYIVLTDEEADEMAARYIKDCLWAFNADFIIQHSKLPYEAEEMIRSYQHDKCEGANDTIEALIEDMDTFIEAAISADGRGHFLNTYDGNENEETLPDGFGTFYIYRIN